MSDIVNEFGPMPEIDRNAEIEAESIQALTTALSDLFIVRTETGRDYGVDFLLEAKERKTPLNCRAQAQLKGTDTPKFLRDGTVSLQVTTSSFCYLLNGPCPIYFLYITKTGEIRYLWAFEEKLRLDNEDSEWKKQAKISLHFSKILTPDSKDNIRREVIEHGIFHRRLADALIRSKNFSSGAVVIDPASLSVSEPDKIKEHILKFGISLVLSGKATSLIEQSEKIPQIAAKNGYIQFLLAYANASIGRFLKADDHITQALIYQNDLDESVKSFLDCLRNECDYHTGRIEREECIKRENRILGTITDDKLRLQIEIYIIRASILSEIGIEERKKAAYRLLEILRETHQIRDHHSALLARIAVLEVEGGTRSILAVERMYIAKAKHIAKTSSEASPEISAALLSKLIEPWTNQVNEILIQTKEVGNPLILGDAYAASAKVLLGLALLVRNFQLSLNSPQLDLKKYTDMAISYIKAAISIFEASGNTYETLRSKMLLSDCYRLSGDMTKSKELSGHIQPLAEAFRYSRIAQYAAEQVADNTPFDAKPLAMGDVDEDLFFSSYVGASSPDGLDDLIDFLCEAGNLPEREKRSVMQEVISAKTVSERRIQYCQHIDAIPTNTALLQGITNISWKGKCSKFGFQTELLVEDTSIALDSLARNKCGTCEARSPKQIEAGQISQLSSMLDRMKSLKV